MRGVFRWHGRCCPRGRRFPMTYARRSNVVRARRDRGITLIEIMVVLVLLGLIATSIRFMTVDHWKEAHQLRTARLQVRGLAGSVRQYIVARGGCPSVED